MAKKIKDPERARCQHPLKILTLTTKNFWLLLIPLVRGLIALRFDLYNWIKGAWLDILVLCLIFGFAYIRWYCIKYCFREDGILYRTGVIAHSEVLIPYSSVSAASAEKNFFLKPVRAATVCIDTNSGSVRNPDAKLLISYNEFCRLEEIMQKKYGQGLRSTYIPSKRNLVLFSFLFSSTLSGIIYISTLFIQAGNLVSRELEEMLLYTFNDVVSKLAVGLPPAVVAVSLIIIGMWLFSFISNLLRHIGFRITKYGGNIEIRSGFFTKRAYFINSDKINYADIRQNLLMKLFRVMSVNVSCAGYGKAKNEIPVFVPITTKKQVISSMQLLLPGLDIPTRGVHSKFRYIFRFLWLPLLMSAVCPVGGYLLLKFFSDWSRIIIFGTIMCEIPSIWLLIVKITAFFTTGLFVSEKGIAAKYCNGYAFHTVAVQRERIAKIKISQTIFQYNMHSCDVYIYTNSEFTKSHIVKNMPYEAAKELLTELDYIENY